MCQVKSNFNDVMCGIDMYESEDREVNDVYTTCTNVKYLHFS